MNQSRRAATSPVTVSDALHKADFFASRENSHALEPYGVTMYQAMSLIYVAEHEEETSVNQRAIERYTRLSNPGVKKLIDALVKLGYVERSLDPSDNRSYILRTTAAGRAQSEVFKVVIAESDARITATLSPSEQESLIRLLEKLTGQQKKTEGGRSYELSGAL
jgi:DNA-binding MarR family transcriptional regulator